MEGIELVDLRKRREKHFLQKNGDIVVQMYDDDIHYKKDNIYLDINNNLIEEKGLYTNKANDYKVYFKSNEEKNYMTMIIENHYLKFSLINGKIVNPLVKNNYIKYSNVLNNIDIEYKILANEIKENIVLKDINAINNDIEFIIETNFELTVNNNTILCSDGDCSFTLNIPFMISNDGLLNYNIAYELKKNSDNYILKLILDKNWLKKVEFPVIIDPTIINNSNSNSVYDTYIYPGDTNVDRNNQDILKVGIEKINNQDVINRALIKFDLPTIGTGSQVVEATLDLIGYGYTEELLDSEIINVHRITSDWTETDANWNNMNSNYNSRIEGYVNSSFSRILYNSNNNTATLNASHNTVDITNLVKKWYSDTPNYGIMLKANEEVYKSSKVPSFYSKNNTFPGDNPKPLLIIKYRNQSGLESYMDYQSQSFIKGYTHINTYNGNLISVFDLGSTIGGNLPAKLSLVYNTNDVILLNDTGLGIGYKYNLFQTIENVNIDNINYLKYLDEDGTIHYFLEKSQNIYEDEDGLNMVIELSSNEYVLSDRNNNKLKFFIDDSVGYLYQIQNADNNTISITFDNNHQITKVVDSSSNEININYTNNSITIICPNETIIINKENNNISQIVYKLGSTLFSYNNRNLIEYITDINGQKIKYEYHEQLPYKVMKVSQYGLNDTLGQFFNIEYGFNATAIIDNKNRAIVKTFNNNGNLVSTSNLKDESNIENAYGFKNEYDENYNNNSQYKNKLLSSQVPIKYIKNYISNSSFESDDIMFNSDDIECLSITTQEAHTGFKCLKATVNYSFEATKMLTVPKGKYYTFSIFIKNNCKVNLSLSYDNGEGNWNTNYCICYENNEWHRESISIYYPEDAVSDLEVSIYYQPIGEVYIDDIQLEEGEIANNYNLIDDSNFENGLSNWIMSAFDNETGNPLLVNNVFDVVTLENNETNALKINMKPNYSSSIDKIYNISGKAGEVYNISFWYKNEGLYASGLVGDPICNNIAIMYDYIENGEYTGQCTFQAPPFNVNDQHWQFYSASFVALDDFNSFKLSLYQDGNANNMYVTNMCLIKDIREVNYDYDEKGNIVSISGLNNESVNYDYDDNNQLIKITEPMGSNYRYEYDNLIINRMLNKLSGNGISNRIIYDTFGNPIFTKIKNVNLNEITNGQYRIRLKGTNKYIRNIQNQLVVNEDNYGYDLWNIEIIGDYCKICHNIISDKYICYYNDRLCLYDYSNYNSLFELIKNNNGSYTIALKQDNILENKKYLCFDDNYNLLINENEIDNYHYEFYLETFCNKKFIENSSIYSSDGKFIQSTTNALLNTMNYNIDNMTGLINSVTDSNNNTKNYYYDNKDRLLTIEVGNRTISYTYDENNLITKISTDSIEYNLSYDVFNNLHQVRVGNNYILISNTYDNNNGSLLSTVYGNGDEVLYNYDDYDRVESIEKYDNIYMYKYDNNGNLAKIISNDDCIEYLYDLSGKINEYRYNCVYNYPTFSIDYLYDSNSNVVNKKYRLGSETIMIQNEFDDDNSIIRTTFDNNNINYRYDYLGRIECKSINNNYSINYEYMSLGNRTSTILKSIDNNNDKISYKYDKMNNITHIYHNNILENEYIYDSYNELIEEKNYIFNSNIKYSYDSNGNLVSKKIYNLTNNELVSQNLYEYNNNNWSDQLTKFNNKTITYDLSGNPLTIGSQYLTWINGRQLSSISDLSNNISFRYDVSGIRISKIVNDVETVYYTENDSIILEKTGNNMIKYIRNEIDDLIGFIYNNQQYYYIKNAQNDIIGILDSFNNIIAKYSYDSLGNILAITDNNNLNITDTSHIAYINPFRYRSYYYDSETGLYYLNNRYYSPIFGRFINADGEIGTGSDILGYNLYSYCCNNFINCYDLTGMSLFKDIVKFARKTWRAFERQVWTNVSDLLGLFGMNYSGKFLSKSLSDNPQNVVLDDDKELVKKVKKDSTIKEYNSEIKKKNGLFSVKPDVKVLSDRDLKGSFYHVTISSSGSYHNGCGKYTISIYDKYDYEWHWKYNYNLTGFIFWVGNNLATIGYNTGAIQDYEIRLNLKYDIPCACNRSAEE